MGCREEQPQIPDNIPAQKLLGPSGSTTQDLPDLVPPDISLVSLKEQSDDSENQLGSTNQKTANTCSYRQGECLLFKDNGGGNKDDEEQTTSTFNSLLEEVITTEEEDSQEFSETIEDETRRSESDQSIEDNEPLTDPKICFEDNGSESSEVDSSIPPTFNYSHESKDTKEFPDTYMYQDPLENIEAEFCEENQNIDEDTSSTNEEEMEGASTGTVKHQVPATLETGEQGNNPIYRCDLYEEAAINEVEDVVNYTNSKNEKIPWSERNGDCIITCDLMNSQPDDETVGCFLTSPKLEQFLDVRHEEIVVGPSCPHEGK